jgi:hypothetical protein
MEDIIEKKDDMKVTRTFKDYYADPEYKKRHLAYVLEKVECNICNTMVARCNMSKHKNSMRHKRIQQALNGFTTSKKVDAEKLKELFDEALKKYLDNKE